MNRCYWIDIFKSNTIIIFINNIRGYKIILLIFYLMLFLIVFFTYPFIYFLFYNFIIILINIIIIIIILKIKRTFIFWRIIFINCFIFEMIYLLIPIVLIFITIMIIFTKSLIYFQKSQIHNNCKMVINFLTFLIQNPIFLHFIYLFFQLHLYLYCKGYIYRRI